jgi:hypothetical protein
MDNQIETVFGVLATVLGVLLLLAAALLVYALWLIERVLRFMEESPRRAGLERDGSGRPLRERK